MSPRPVILTPYVVSFDTMAAIAFRDVIDLNDGMIATKSLTSEDKGIAHGPLNPVRRLWKEISCW
jgi:hypothetical protein